MKKTIKKKWLKALRSGYYSQTMKHLKDESGFCCLGVLCDLYIKDTKRATWKTLGLNNHLTLDVAKWAGLEPKEMIIDKDNPKRGEVGIRVGRVNLADYNDSGRSFQEISKLIETKM